MLSATFSAIAFYGHYRMTQRSVVPVDEIEHYLGVLPSATDEAVEAASAWASELAKAGCKADAQS